MRRTRAGLGKGARRIAVALAGALLPLCSASGEACAEESPTYDGAYITQDTTWSGTVLLRGQNVVRRGSTLTILPGTVVKFLWSDENADGIGDGELTVEGRLVARGGKDRRITFTSGREKPGMKDWTYVQVSVNKDAVVEYCVFEHAFTGLQAHYSSATIRNCLFRGNFEGLRFSTAHVLIEHNEIVDNAYGIRYEAHGSRTVVTRNVIRGNGTAFFPVRKSWDSVMIHENNIERSSSYHVKMGQEQPGDVDFTRNWWGTADAAEIEASLFDRAEDETLGRVLFVPFLTEPAPDCGIQ